MMTVFIHDADFRRADALIDAVELVRVTSAVPITIRATGAVWSTWTAGAATAKGSVSGRPRRARSCKSTGPACACATGCSDSASSWGPRGAANAGGAGLTGTLLLLLRPRGSEIAAVQTLEWIANG